MEYKICSICNELKSIDDFYTQNREKANGEEYTYFHPECKDCSKKKARIWQVNNRDKMREAFKKCDSSPKRKKIKRDFAKKQRENGYFKQYQQENKDKFSDYGKMRRMNKSHDITEDEWLNCLEFFSYKCAYCGMSEEDAIAIYGQRLHKEHVDHNGSNDISNNVPACKGCNSKKWEHEFSKWYNKENTIYDEDRYNKIIKWLISFEDKPVKV